MVYDEAGAPYAVRYQLLAPMLVNELQKQQRMIETLVARLQELERQVSAVATAGGG